MNDERQKRRRDMLAEIKPSKLDKLRKRLVRVAAPRSRPVAKGSALAEAGAQAARRAVDLRAAIDHAGGIYLADRLHRVRVAAKKLRYALEIQRELTQFAIDRAIEPVEGATGPAGPHARSRDPDRSRARRAGRS